MRILVISLLVVVLLSLLLIRLDDGRGGAPGDALVVYCAAGLRLPVAEAAARFEKELGIPVRLEHGSSGELEGKILLEKESGTNRSDIYIPADQSFVERATAKGLLRESIPLARFHLVLAVKKGNPSGIEGIDDLLDGSARYLLCDEKAGAGKRTQQALEGDGTWARLMAGAKAVKPRVTEVASDVAISSAVDCAIVWMTTAQQFGLDTVEIPQLTAAGSTIIAAVTDHCRRPTEALRLARYLSAPERGQPIFANHGFQPVDGDHWQERPRLTFFSGGVNREAVEETIDLFSAREGCEIKTLFAGCGALVQTIEAGQNPDAFLTCDVSYMEKVAGLFGEASDVSSTDMLILVSSENRRNIANFEDLARTDVTLAIADPEKTALGDLTRRLFVEAGVWDVVGPRVLTAPSAHELFLMMAAGEQKLDAVVVYRANCNNIGDHLAMIPIAHPSALAFQNIAIGNSSKHPNLTRRLIDALLSKESQERFAARGFAWRARQE